MEEQEISFVYEISQTQWSCDAMLSFLEDVEKQLKKRVEYPDDTFPPREKIFRALRVVPPKRTRVLILGQDPYHTLGVANGFAFASRKIPPSLANIFKELKSDGFTPGTTGNLDKWVEQGVMLLNTALTVKNGIPDSHKKIWDGFVKLMIPLLGKTGKPYVAILWGGNAKKYESVIKKNGGVCITSAHPSPMSADRGFFGSKPFSQANRLLREMGRAEIDWSLQ